MKYLLIIGDGMADERLPELGNKTPLEYLRPPGMARIGAGEAGRFLSCPAPLAPGSDVAFLSILGCNPRNNYPGRSPLEAAGMGVPVIPGQTAFRMNLVSIEDIGYPSARLLSHNGGGVEGEDVRVLLSSLLNDKAFSLRLAELKITIHPTDSFRHLAVMDGEYIKDFTPPHDLVGQSVQNGKADDALFELQALSFAHLAVHPVNARRRAAGLLPANSVWFWGEGAPRTLPDFNAQFGYKGAVVSAVPLVKGIARLTGLSAPDIPGATGLLNTDYEAKVNAAMRLFGEGYDFVLLHVEAPDELSHDGDLRGKLEAISRLDARIVLPMLEKLTGRDHRVMLMPDHYTLLSTRTHDATPVPYAIYDGKTTSGARAFTEALCESAPILESGAALLNRLFRRESPV